jgi:hypothetical protein
MINESKPTTQTPQTELNVGSGYNLLVGGVYRLIIGALGAAGMTNTSKVSVGETWNTISTSWNTETRTWLAASQLITNTALSSTDPIWSARTFPWQSALPWQNTNAGIINQSKP